MVWGKRRPQDTKLLYQKKKNNWRMTWTVREAGGVSHDHLEEISRDHKTPIPLSSPGRKGNWTCAASCGNPNKDAPRKHKNRQGGDEPAFTGRAFVRKGEALEVVCGGDKKKKKKTDECPKRGRGGVGF